MNRVFLRKECRFAKKILMIFLSICLIFSVNVNVSSGYAWAVSSSDNGNNDLSQNYEESDFPSENSDSQESAAPPQETVSVDFEENDNVYTKDIVVVDNQISLPEPQSLELEFADDDTKIINNHYFVCWSIDEADYFPGDTYTLNSDNTSLVFIGKYEKKENNSESFAGPILAANSSNASSLFYFNPDSSPEQAPKNPGSLSGDGTFAAPQLRLESALNSVKSIYAEKGEAPAIVFLNYFKKFLNTGEEDDFEYVEYNGNLNSGLGDVVELCNASDYYNSHLFQFELFDHGGYFSQRTYDLSNFYINTDSGSSIALRAIGGIVNFDNVKVDGNISIELNRYINPDYKWDKFLTFNNVPNGAHYNFQFDINNLPDAFQRYGAEKIPIGVIKDKNADLESFKIADSQKKYVSLSYESVEGGDRIIYLDQKRFYEPDQTSLKQYIFVSPEKGNNDNNGFSHLSAVKTFDRVQELLAEPAYQNVDTVFLTDDVSISEFEKSSYVFDKNINFERWDGSFWTFAADDSLVETKVELQDIPLFFIDGVSALTFDNLCLNNIGFYPVYVKGCNLTLKNGKLAAKEISEESSFISGFEAQSSTLNFEDFVIDCNYCKSAVEEDFGISGYVFYLDGSTLNIGTDLELTLGYGNKLNSVIFADNNSVVNFNGDTDFEEPFKITNSFVTMAENLISAVQNSKINVSGYLKDYSVVTSNIFNVRDANLTIKDFKAEDCDAANTLIAGFATSVIDVLNINMVNSNTSFSLENAKASFKDVNIEKFNNLNSRIFYCTASAGLSFDVVNFDKNSIKDSSFMSFVYYSGSYYGSSSIKNTDLSNNTYSEGLIVSNSYGYGNVSSTKFSSFLFEGNDFNSNYGRSGSLISISSKYTDNPLTITKNTFTNNYGHNSIDVVSDYDVVFTYNNYSGNGQLDSGKGVNSSNTLISVRNLYSVADDVVPTPETTHLVFNNNTVTDNLSSTNSGVYLTAGDFKTKVYDCEISNNTAGGLSTSSEYFSGLKLARIAPIKQKDDSYLVYGKKNLGFDVDNCNVSNNSNACYSGISYFDYLNNGNIDWTPWDNDSVVTKTTISGNTGFYQGLYSVDAQLCLDGGYAGGSAGNVIDKNSNQKIFLTGLKALKLSSNRKTQSGSTVVSDSDKWQLDISGLESSEKNIGKYIVSPSQDGIDLSNDLDAFVISGFNPGTFAVGYSNKIVIAEQTVWLDGVHGSDSNSGLDIRQPVKSFTKAKTVLNSKISSDSSFVPNITVLDCVSVTGTETWNGLLDNGTNANVLRWACYGSNLVSVNTGGNLTMYNVNFKGFSALSIYQNTGIAYDGAAILVNGGTLKCGTLGKVTFGYEPGVDLRITNGGNATVQNTDITGCDWYEFLIPDRDPSVTDFNLNYLTSAFVVEDEDSELYVSDSNFTSNNKYLGVISCYAGSAATINNCEFKYNDYVYSLVNNFEGELNVDSSNFTYNTYKFEEGDTNRFGSLIHSIGITETNINNCSLYENKIMKNLTEFAYDSSIFVDDGYPYYDEPGNSNAVIEDTYVDKVLLVNASTTLKGRVCVYTGDMAPEPTTFEMQRSLHDGKTTQPIHLSEDKPLLKSSEYKYRLKFDSAYLGSVIVDGNENVKGEDYINNFFMDSSCKDFCPGLTVIDHDITTKTKHIYLNGISGDDGNTGISSAAAVKTFDQAKSILMSSGSEPDPSEPGDVGSCIVVCGTLNFDMSSDQSLTFLNRKADGSYSWDDSKPTWIPHFMIDPSSFEGTEMVHVSGNSAAGQKTLTFNNFIFDGNFNTNNINGIEIAQSDNGVIFDASYCQFVNFNTKICTVNGTNVKKVDDNKKTIARFSNSAITNNGLTGEKPESLFKSIDASQIDIESCTFDKNWSTNFIYSSVSTPTGIADVELLINNSDLCDTYGPIYFDGGPSTVLDDSNSNLEISYSNFTFTGDCDTAPENDIMCVHLVNSQNVNINNCQFDCYLTKNRNLYYCISANDPNKKNCIWKLLIDNCKFNNWESYTGNTIYLKIGVWPKATTYPDAILIKDCSFNNCFHANDDKNYGYGATLYYEATEKDYSINHKWYVDHCVFKRDSGHYDYCSAIGSYYGDTVIRNNTDISGCGYKNNADNLGGAVSVECSNLHIYDSKFHECEGQAIYWHLQWSDHSSESPYGGYWYIDIERCEFYNCIRNTNGAYRLIDFETVGYYSRSCVINVKNINVHDCGNGKECALHNCCSGFSINNSVFERNYFASVIRHKKWASYYSCTTVDDFSGCQFLNNTLTGKDSNNNWGYIVAVDFINDGKHEFSPQKYDNVKIIGNICLNYASSNYGLIWSGRPNISNSEIRDNKITSDNASRVQMGSVITWHDCNKDLPFIGNITDTIITNNGKPEGHSLSTNDLEAGAIFVRNGTLNIKNSTIESSYSYNGGAYTCVGSDANGQDAKLILDNSHIKNCSSQTYGGAISANRNVNFKLEMKNGSTIESCTSAQGGGAVYAYNAEMDITNSQIKACSSIAKDSTSQVYGGAICNLYAERSSEPIPNPHLILSGSSAINGCSSKTSFSSTDNIKGGAVYWDCPSCGIELNDSSNISDCSAPNGGALYIKNGSLAFAGDSMMMNNTATNGGAVYMDFSDDNTLFIMKDNALATGNKAQDTGGSFYFLNSNDSRSVTFERGYVINGSAKIGGSIYSEQQIALSGTNFLMNETTLNTSSNSTIENSGDIHMNNWIYINTNLSEFDDTIFLQNNDYSIVQGQSFQGSRKFTINVNTNMEDEKHFEKNNKVVIPDTEKGFDDSSGYIGFFVLDNNTYILVPSGVNIVLGVSVFIDGINGNDSNNGLYPDTAYKTIETAINSLDGLPGKIYVSGTIYWDSSSHPDFCEGQSLIRYSGFTVSGIEFPAFEGLMVDIVSGTVSLNQFATINGANHESTDPMFRVESGATLKLNGTTLTGSVTSTTEGGAITNYGNVEINGGYVVSSSDKKGNSIYHAGQSLILSKDPTISGTVYLEGETAKIDVDNLDNDFNPGNAIAVNISDPTNDRLVVEDTKKDDFADINKFVLDASVSCSFILANNPDYLDQLILQVIARVYVDPLNTSATINGVTPDTAFKTLEDAYDVVNKTETGCGTIVIVNPIEASSESLSLTLNSVTWGSTSNTYPNIRSLNLLRYAKPDKPVTGYTKNSNKDYLFKATNGKSLTVDGFNISGSSKDVDDTGFDAYDIKGIHDSSSLIFVDSSSTFEIGKNSQVVLFDNDCSENSDSIKSNGGAIYAAENSITKTFNAIFRETKAKNGGGIYTDGTLEMIPNTSATPAQATSFESCSTCESGCGGALYVDVNSDTVIGPAVSILGNCSATHGSAMSIKGNCTAYGLFNITGEVYLVNNDDNDAHLTLGKSDSAFWQNNSQWTFDCENAFDGKWMIYDYKESATTSFRLSPELAGSYYLFLNTTDSKKYELKANPCIYIDGKWGNDSNDGLSPDTSVKSVTKAASLLEEHKSGTLFICGAMVIASNESVSISENVIQVVNGSSSTTQSLTVPLSICRFSEPTESSSLPGFINHHSFKEALFEVSGSLTLSNIFVDGHAEAVSGKSRALNSPGVESEKPIAIVNGSSANLSLFNSELVNNNNKEGSVAGGAVHLDGGSMNVFNSSFLGNSADNGSAIYAKNSATISLLSASNFGDREVYLDNCYISQNMTGKPNIDNDGKINVDLESAGYSTNRRVVAECSGASDFSAAYNEYYNLKNDVPDDIEYTVDLSTKQVLLLKKMAVKFSAILDTNPLPKPSTVELLDASSDVYSVLETKSLSSDGKAIFDDNLGYPEGSYKVRLVSEDLTLDFMSDVTYDSHNEILVSELQLYSVIYDTNGKDTDSIPNSIVKANTVIGTPPDAPTTTGYTFGNWYCDPECTIGPWAFDKSAVTSPNFKLYASWNANQTQITFNKKGGSGGSISVTAYYGQSLPKIITPTYGDQAFDGYSFDTGESLKRYYDYSGTGKFNWDIDEPNVTLDAIWFTSVCKKVDPSNVTVYYSSLEHALAQCGTSGTEKITMLANSDENELNVLESTNVELDLNGFTVGKNNEAKTVFEIDGQLSLFDSSSSKSGQIVAKQEEFSSSEEDVQGTIRLAGNSSSCVLNDVAINGAVGDCVAIVGSSASFIMNSGKIIGGDSDIKSVGIYAKSQPASIYGGLIDCLQSNQIAIATQDNYPIPVSTVEDGIVKGSIILLDGNNPASEQKPIVQISGGWTSEDISTTYASGCSLIAKEGYEPYSGITYDWMLVDPDAPNTVITKTTPNSIKLVFHDYKQEAKQELDLPINTSTSSYYKLPNDLFHAPEGFTFVGWDTTGSASEEDKNILPAGTICPYDFTLSGEVYNYYEAYTGNLIKVYLNKGTEESITWDLPDYIEIANGQFINLPEKNIPDWTGHAFNGFKNGETYYLDECLNPLEKINVLGGDEFTITAEWLNVQTSLELNNTYTGEVDPKTQWINVTQGNAMPPLSDSASPWIPKATDPHVLFEGFYDEACNKQYYNSSGSPSVDSWDRKDTSYTINARWSNRDDLVYTFEYGKKVSDVLSDTSLSCGLKIFYYNPSTGVKKWENVDYSASLIDSSFDKVYSVNESAAGVYVPCTLQINSGQCSGMSIEANVKIDVHPVKANFNFSTDPVVYNAEEITPSVTITNKVAGDDLGIVYSIIEGPSTSEIKDAGSYKISITGFTGASKDNYELPDNPSGRLGTVVVEKKEVTISGVKAKSRDYNGTAVAEIDCDNVVITGVCGSEDLKIKGIVGFFEDSSRSENDPNAGVNKPVYLNYYFGDGAKLYLDDEIAKNYKLPVEADISKCQVYTDATINPYAFTPEIDTVENKTYDGNVQAVATLKSVNYFADETITFSNVKASFADPNSADNIAVSIDTFDSSINSPYLISNYSIAAPVKILPKSAKIEKRTVDLSWSDKTFTYDTYEHKPTCSISNLVEGEFVNVDLDGAQTNAGSHTATAISLSDNIGLDFAKNYKLPDYESGTLSCSFTIDKYIVPASDSDKVIQFNEELSFDGTSREPSVTLIGLKKADGTNEIIDNSTATFTWSNNINSGSEAELSVSINSNPNYETASGSPLVENFYIAQYKNGMTDVAAFEYELPGDSETHSLVFDEDSHIATVSLKSNLIGEGLSQDESCGDLTIYYQRNIGGDYWSEKTTDAPLHFGTYRVLLAVEGGRNFAAVPVTSPLLLGTFTINKKDLSTDISDITVDVSSLDFGTYDGKAKSPSEFIIGYNGVELKQKTEGSTSWDYSYEWSNNVNTTTEDEKITLTITANDNVDFTGSKTFVFDLDQLKIEQFNNGVTPADAFEVNFPIGAVFDWEEHPAYVGLKSQYSKTLGSDEACGELTWQYQLCDASGAPIGDKVDEPPVDAGTYKVWLNVEGARNFAPASDVDMGTFTIAKKSIDDPSNVMIDTSNIVFVPYNGEAQSPNDFTVVYSGKILEQDTDYTFSWSNNVNASYIDTEDETNSYLPTLTITGKNDSNFTGSVTLTYNESDRSNFFIDKYNGGVTSIDAFDFILPGDDLHSWVYDQIARPAEVKLKDEYTETMSQDEACGEITVLYSKYNADTGMYEPPVNDAPKNAGTYKVMIMVGGGKNFAPTYSPLEYKIGDEPVTIVVDPAKVHCESGIVGIDKVYDRTNDATVDSSDAVLVGILPGDECGIENVSGTFDSTDIGDNIHMTLDYKSCVLSNPNYVYDYYYEGSDQQLDAYASISPKEMTSDMIEFVPPEFIYDGQSHSPEVIVWHNGVAIDVDIDYTIEKTSEIYIGSYVVTITGLGNYTGSAQATWRIGGDYIIMEGQNAIYYQGTFTDLLFRCNGSFKEFAYAEVDGNVLSQSFYKAYEGSTYIQLYSDFLETQEPGMHTLKFVYDGGGSAIADYEVVGRPDLVASSDFTYQIVIGLLAVCVASGCCLLLRRRKFN